MKFGTSSEALAKPLGANLLGIYQPSETAHSRSSLLTSASPDSNTAFQCRCRARMAPSHTLPIIVLVSASQLLPSILVLVE